MNGDRWLRSAGLAVVGLDTTVGVPPLVVQTAVYHLAGGRVTGGPFTYPAAVDVPLAQVPVRLWPSVRLAPPWAEVADRLLIALGERTVVVHDQARLDVLRRHLPGWQPAEVVFVRGVAERWRPRLAGDCLDPQAAPATNSRQSRVGTGAVAEAHAVAMLLAALHATGQPVPQPFGLTGAGLPVRPARQAGTAAPGQGGGGLVPGRPAVGDAGGPGASPLIRRGRPRRWDPGPRPTHHANAEGAVPVNSLEQPVRRERPEKTIWNAPEMRAAVEIRDFTVVYRLLQKRGYSQQRIAALTGQSQPEVSAIIHGRKVMAYDVILRIVDGLGIPRGLAGLSACACSEGEGEPEAPAPAS